MHPPILITPSTELPVSLEEAKAHLRVEHDEEDSLIEGLIRAATDHLSGWSGRTGRALLPQTWEQDFDRFHQLRLRIGPVREVQSVTYYDSEGDQQTLDASVYALRQDAQGAYLDLAAGQSWPATDGRVSGIRITYEAGYDETPAAIRQAMLLLIGHWYEHRQAVASGVTVAELPLAVDALLTPYRRAV